MSSNQIKKAALQDGSDHCSLGSSYALSRQDVTDIRNALDVLCGCYANGIESTYAQELLSRYGPGTKDGIRARTLFNRL